MVLFKLLGSKLFFRPKLHFAHWRIAHDETIQEQVLISQLRSHIGLQILEELNLWVSETFEIANALRVDKRNVLLLSVQYPKDEIRIEIVCLEEAQALLALVAKQIHLLASKHIIPMLITILAESLNKVLLTQIQWYRTH